MNSVEENSKVNVRATILSSDKLQVAAVFDSTEQAKQALQQLESEASIDSHQSEVITPSDPRLSAKLEEKSSQIASSLWTSHLALAAIGFTAGMITAFLLTQYGPALTQQNPIFTYIALISPGTFIGLFIAGLIGLRPDRSEIIRKVSDAVRSGKSALIVNLRGSQNAKAVSQILQAKSNSVVESIK